MNDLINIFKMLSDETRLRIIIALYHKDLCVCQLTGILELSQPKVSKNLSKLKDLKLVKDDRKDKFVVYSLSLENEVFKRVVETIVRDMESHGQLMTDKERFQYGDEFLNSCITNFKG